MARPPPRGDDETVTPADVTGTASTGTAPTGVAPTLASAPPPASRARAAMPTSLGRYPIVAELGAGGMGIVYRARDATLGRALAIKLIRPRHGGTEGRARFLREAQAMARLQHPNVVPIFDVGEHGDAVYLVMPLCTGGTLASWLRAAPRPWREVVARLVAAARGLGAAHAAGMVHRDFKPDNVLLGDDGEVQVADFGIARLDGDDVPGMGDAATADGLELTRTGTLLGTPLYMAPEQLRGEPVDARADVFACCVSLYEGVYGLRPFDPGAARGAAALTALRQRIERGLIEPPPPDRDVPAWLHAVILRGLRPRPADRWPTIDALRLALERGLAPRRRRAIAIGALPIAAIGAGRAYPLTRG